MAEAILGLGANLGARRASFCAAIALLEALPGCRVLARSPLYETPPLGPPQPDYLNAALRIAWDGDVDALLAATQHVERLLGRERSVHWGPRTLDIDILEWSEGAVRRPGLELPHRDLGQRPFALAPLLDVAPQRAGVWGTVLAALGGAPPQADPGWPTASDEGAWRVSGWVREESELVSQLGSMLASAEPAPASARAALGFSLDGARLAADPVACVEQLLARARAGGFRACGMAVTRCEAVRTVGVLVGQECAEGSALPASEARIEQGERGLRRVRVRV